jgi:GNAT superfamily N-acetyltransferase
MKPTFTFMLRLATEEDIPALDALIEASVRGLQAGDYSQAQIEGALGTVLGLDTQLIRDGTYFVAEVVCSDERSPSELREEFPSGAKAHLHFSTFNVRAEARTLQEPCLSKEPCRSDARSAISGGTLAGCGGWSKRKTLFGSDRGPGRELELLDPRTDAAKVRAIFVHPEFARRGLGTLILARVEAEARAAGFRRFEMGSTLTGVPLYRLRGYVEVERIAVPLTNGEVVPVVKMVKEAG